LPVAGCQRATGNRQPATEVPVPRENIIMECTVCKSRNYFTTKNRRKHPERAEWKKFCPRCNKQQQHKESK
jgi:large subunit ribosomal protein L33